jgi:hypothetical protein
MKQTITEVTLEATIDDISIEVVHTRTEVEIIHRKDGDMFANFYFPAIAVDSLIEMLQKRKELMG